MAQSDLLLVQCPKHLYEVHLYILFAFQWNTTFIEVKSHYFLALESTSVHKCFSIQLLKIGDQAECAEKILFSWNFQSH